MAPHRAATKAMSAVRRALAALLGLSLPALLPAGAEGVGTTSANFLKIPAHARPAALAEAFSALSDNEAALQYNPAGLARLMRDRISATHIEWFQNIQLDHLGGALLSGQHGALAASATFLRVEGLTRTKRVAGADPVARIQEQGSFSPFDMAFNVGGGYEIEPGVLLGGGLRAVAQDVDGRSGWGLSADLGAQWLNLVEGIELGAVLQSLGTPVGVGGTAFEQPLALRLGALTKLWQERASLAFELALPADNEPQPSLGLETWPVQSLALRTGWRGGFAQQFSAGLGFRMDRWEMDYAWVPFSDLGHTHRITATLLFGLPPVGLDLDLPLMAPLGDAPWRVESFRLSAGAPSRAESWLLELRAADGRVLRKLRGVGAPPPLHSWDGRDESGQVPPDGLVQAILSVDYGGQQLASSRPREIELDSTPPATRLDLEGWVLRPNGQRGLRPPTAFNLAATDKHGVGGWKLELRDPQGAVLRSWSGDGPPPARLDWDGTDAQGKPLKVKQPYLARLSARDRLGLWGQGPPLPFSLLPGEFRINLSADALFEPGRANVRISAYQKLKEVKALLLQHYQPGSKISIIGNTDNQPIQASAYPTNLALSEARAKAVVEFMVTLLNMDARWFEAKGQGDSRPIATNATEEGREANRRVEVIIQSGE